MEQKFEVLKKFFGYDEFRTGQEQLIDWILSRQDTVGIMPTGAGKSVCYQVPALIFSDITIVVSPLISLMKDQVNFLVQSGVRAAYINSSLTESQIQRVIENAKQGVYKIIYVAPERLLTPRFIDFASSSDISMVTIDEAHCISQWGQDFRPSYRNIPEFISCLSVRPVVSAFTATATEEVKGDIVKQLDVLEPKIMTTGFDRANLFFEVQKPDDKFEFLLRYLTRHEEKVGIVYCLTRKNVDDVTRRLNELGIASAAYHAGLPDKERAENQDMFIYDKVRVMVATNAFGMGIDKSNVNFVIHYNMPKNLENYYQEAGRAGRDGSEADCILLFNGQDVVTNNWLIENGNGRATSSERDNEEYIKQDRERLKEMVQYCKTNKCLRNYILGYFGEECLDDCGQCSNCLEQFEKIDVASEIKIIVGAVKSTRQRFGSAVIKDMLRGSRNKKVLMFKLEQSEYLGKLRKLNKELIDSIFDFMIENNYIYMTNERFPSVRIGEASSAIFENDEEIFMTIAANEKAKVKVSVKKVVDTRNINNELLAELKLIRNKLAKERSVPAYVIFSDSTLIDMCKVHPLDNETMLTVSGVGEVKLERYGQAFLDVLSKFEPYETISSDGSAPDGANLKEKESVFDINEVEYSGFSISISVLVDKINTQIEAQGYKKVSARQANNILVEEGYLLVGNDFAGKPIKVPSEKGLELGIVAEEREGDYGAYIVCLYNRHAQEKVLELLACKLDL